MKYDRCFHLKRQYKVEENRRLADKIQMGCVEHTITIQSLDLNRVQVIRFSHEHVQ